MKFLSSSAWKPSSFGSMRLASRNVMRGTLPCASRSTQNGFGEG